MLDLISGTGLASGGLKGVNVTGLRTRADNGLKRNA